MSEEAPAIGIDLGTTNSCVAVFLHERVEIITNEHRNRTTPSCVVFTKSGRLFGEAAQKIVIDNPTSNTVYDAKRLIGRRFDDSLLLDAKNMPIEVINNQGNPMIAGVEYKGERKTFFPEEISAMILFKMKETAEAYVGKTVTKAVITVPAHFNDSQRRATKNAGTIAGLNVLRIMNEPSAAAMAYAFQKKDEGKRKVLIFSLGEWSCDVSVVALHGGSCKVKSTRGDTRVGGQHFNSRMIAHFIKLIKNKYEQDLSSNQRSIFLLRAACDDAKKLLSSAMEAPIEIDSLLPGIEFKSSIDRATFERLNDDLFFLALELAQKTIMCAGMDDAQIDEIILVGRSTRIPKIQRLLRQFFSAGQKLYQSISVDEIVAHGAAIQAGILIQGDISDLLKDVAPLALGIGITDDITRTLIKANTTIPDTVTSSFYTSFENQQSIEFPFCEGKRIKFNENRLLGKITVDGIHPAPEGVAEIIVTFSVAADGILCVSAATECAGSDSKITITYEDARLAENVIARLIEDAERYRLDDIHHKQELEKARDSVVSYCQDAISRFERGTLECHQIINLLLTNPVTNKEEIERKKKMLIGRLMKEICPVHRDSFATNPPVKEEPDESKPSSVCNKRQKTV